MLNSRMSEKDRYVKCPRVADDFKLRCLSVTRSPAFGTRAMASRACFGRTRRPLGCPMPHRSGQFLPFFVGFHASLAAATSQDI